MTEKDKIESLLNGMAVEFSDKLCEIFEKWSSNGDTYANHYEDLMEMCYNYVADREMFCVTYLEKINKENKGQK